ncbi:mce related family protein [Mycobacterium xenopi 4042]|uniref:Mce related family protein n=1 Tax=Mycobacterium xenopi 4042 TaxID=1299334 RepID=X7ZX99_MYCXE|nr:mce related family protein [Mycobacterium xenopi 4042]
MKTSSERSPFRTGILGISILGCLLLTSLNYDKLPLFVSRDKTYSAYFAEAGGLVAGNAVQVSGFRVGQVSRVELDGPRVLVTFHVNRSVHLGDRTEAAIKLKTVLGSKILALTPRGAGSRPARYRWSAPRRLTSCPTRWVTLREPSAGSTPTSCRIRWQY